MIHKKNKNQGAFMTTLFAALFIALASFVPATLLSPSVAAASSSCDARFLGIPPWYRGLTNSDCSLKSPSDFSKDNSNDAGIGTYVWRIALNIIEMVVVITAYVAAFFIIYGGFQFIVGGSNPSAVEKARKTITNAIIGLIIAMAAIVLTNYVFSIM